MQTGAVVRFALRACTGMLVLLGVFWVLVALTVAPPLFTQGFAGVQAKLTHMWMTGLPFDITFSERLAIIHKGYTALILLLLSTWTLREVRGVLYRRMVAQGVTGRR